MADSKNNLISLNKPVSYIAIEGVIGAGKSTIASMLASRLNGKLVLENFDENPYLVRFYRNPSEFAFRTQIFFLIERYTQLQELSQKGLFESYVVSDYIFEKDKIFAYLNLSDDELKLYETISAPLERNIVQPDLVVYLQSTLDMLMKGIRLRNREYEKEITEEYINDLNDAYNYFFSRYKGAKVLIVNCEETDFVNNPQDFENLVNEIFKDDHRAVEYYNPSLRKTAH
jgi:deoxyguanosine kinase